MTRSAWTAREIRARVVGEGANLGVTQAGRIEAARHGVRLNTDALDNSAGVSTSDHEVNIKILLADAEAEGVLTRRAARRAAARDDRRGRGRWCCRQPRAILAVSLEQMGGAEASPPRPR
jgi:glutamate dehydrogenase